MIRRNLEPLIAAARRDTPVVLLNGARQTGKTTLVRAVAVKLRDATYVTLDDAASLAAASHDPQGFIGGLRGTAIIDEVQKATALFPAIKLSVDQDRRPGRFLLTGSANVLTLPRLSESLAGRMEVLTLRTFSQSELEGSHRNFIDLIFGEKPFAGRRGQPTGPSLQTRIHRGGYPEAVRRAAPDRRRRWFASYLTTILQRDIRDLSNIQGLLEAPRLLTLLAARSAGLLNVSELSRTAAIPYTTLQRYLALFEATFLICRILPWSSNLGKRLVKTPRLLLADTGLMAHLLNASEGSILTDPNWSGRFAETFVGGELLKHIEWSQQKPGLFHYRTSTGQEVDFVLEAGRRVAGVEVKAGSSVTAEDFRGLRSLQEDAGTAFANGSVIYTGAAVLPFGPKMWAVPVHELWSL